MKAVLPVNHFRSTGLGGGVLEREGVAEDMGCGLTQSAQLDCLQALSGFQTETISDH